MSQVIARTEPSQPTMAPEVLEADTFAYSSNAIRLTRRQWLAVGLFGLLMILGVPHLWKQAERFEPGPDYRIPYALNTDYWLYDRYAQLAAQRDDVLLIGDSVIWGQYVDPEHTLTHDLNDLAGRNRFANLGLDGTHPAALAGLLEYYGRGIRDKKVVLFCNPLWFSSPRHDLQETKEFNFNHPDLVPQFMPEIPCYKADTNTRLGRAIDRHVPFTGWTNHLQQTYFGGNSIPGWTMEHARELPRGFAEVRHEGPGSDAVPWTMRRMPLANMPWIELDRSFQWHSFQRAVELLQGRGNEVFVLVGPFNEHLLTAASRTRYQRVKNAIRTWLEDSQLSFDMPAPLPTDEYADASHPLAAGYARLAKRLSRQSFFR